MIKPLALAAALLATTSAFADVSIKYTGKDANDPVLSTSMTTSYTTGALHYDDFAGGSFLAYCIEPEQPYALTSKGFKDYTVGSFSGTQGALLQALYSSSFGSVNSGNQQAAFQLALWEITHETGATLSVAQNDGSFFQKTDGLPANQLGSANSVKALTANYLAAAQNYDGPAIYSLAKLSNATYQDLVVATAITSAVPEPQSYALFLSGLGIVGLLARRRLPR